MMENPELNKKDKPSSQDQAEGAAPISADQELSGEKVILDLGCGSHILIDFLNNSDTKINVLGIETVEEQKSKK
jgi:cyclopropane fatty-acyl-phospholipid synthase-like methyltransferase